MITKEQFKEVLEELTAVRYRYERLKLDLQIHRANFYLTIKRNPRPQEYGLEKATENSIEAIINFDDETIKMEHEILEAKDAVNLAFIKYDLAKFEIAMMNNQALQDERKELIDEI